MQAQLDFPLFSDRLDKSITNLFYLNCQNGVSPNQIVLGLCCLYVKLALPGGPSESEDQVPLQIWENLPSEAFRPAHEKL